MTRLACLGLVVACVACESRASYEAGAAKNQAMIGDTVTVNAYGEGVHVVARDTINHVICYGSHVYLGTAISCVVIATPQPRATGAPK